MANPQEYPGAPRWAKILGTLLALVVIVFVVALVAKGPHGAGMHSGDGGTAEARH